jgi:hypothetical protein
MASLCNPYFTHFCRVTEAWTDSMAPSRVKYFLEPPFGDRKYEFASVASQMGIRLPVKGLSEALRGLRYSY